MTDIVKIPDAVAARDLVGYGRNAPEFHWPDDARVVINLVLVYEEGSEASVLWGDAKNEGWGEYAGAGVQPPQRDRGTEGHYEFGSRVGVWRLARIFDEAQVPVTVSATAVALQLNPDVPIWMKERGHDLLGHGWRWVELWELSREDEREHLTRAIATYESVLGERPLGWNSPHWPSENTRSLLLDEGGFLYESDSCADELPFYVREGAHTLLVVPYSKTYNDSRYLISPGFGSPRDYFENLRMGLEQMIFESDERVSMMTIAVHARWSGQASRAMALRQFIEYAKSTPGLRFMRRADIARWWLDNFPPEA